MCQTHRNTIYTGWRAGPFARATCARVQIIHAKISGKRIARNKSAETRRERARESAAMRACCLHKCAHTTAQRQPNPYSGTHAHAEQSSCANMGISSTNKSIYTRTRMRAHLRGKCAHGLRTYMIAVLCLCVRGGRENMNHYSRQWHLNSCVRARACAACKSVPLLCETRAQCEHRISKRSQRSPPESP